VATGNNTGGKNEVKCHCALLEAEETVKTDVKSSPIAEVKENLVSAPVVPAPSPLSEVSNLQPFDSALTALGLSDALDGSDQFASHIDDGAAASSISESERERWLKKLAAQSRAISLLQEQLKSALQRSSDVENKWKDERDLNLRLWDRLMSLQKRMRMMSRPLTTELGLQGRL
jgi:hypothetical protein